MIGWNAFLGFTWLQVGHDASCSVFIIDCDGGDVPSFISLPLPSFGEGMEYGVLPMACAGYWCNSGYGVFTAAYA